MEKKFFVYILALFLFLINTVYAADNVVTSEYKVSADDGFVIYATLKYPKAQKQNEYHTVVLLHSLGYTSQWWEDLPQLMLDNGYAVVEIDLRGHGKSIYNSKLNRVSWSGLTNNAFKKYPADVIKTLNYIKSENKRKFFDNWAIVGADIGAATGVIVAHDIEYKPKTIVMLSPVVKSRGLFVPIKLAELENVDILSISGNGDLSGMSSQEYLKKFAQSTFESYSSESKSTGMLLLKNDKSLSKIILKWIQQYI